MVFYRPFFHIIIEVLLLQVKIEKNLIAVDNYKQICNINSDLIVLEELKIKGSNLKIKYLDKNRIACEIATAILGGGMSSRLFQKVREELGLAYSVYATSARFKDVGTSSIYAGVNPSNVQTAFQAILEVIDTLKKGGITDDEFNKVKCQIKSSTVFSLERVTSKAQLFSKYYINTGELYSVKNRLGELDNVTKNDVIEALNYYDVNNMATAIVGKNVKPLIN